MRQKLTTSDEIRDRLNSFDRTYYDQLYRQMKYAFGEPWDKSIGTSGNDGEFPVYDNIVVRKLGIGQSRRILNNTILTLSRIVTSDPMPTFPQVDHITGELRKEFFLKRYRGGNHGDGNWSREVKNAFIDGNQLGVGVVQLGLRTNPLTGKQHVHARHVPITQVIWDRHERSLGRARWVAFVSYIAPEDVIALYGKDVEKHKREVVDSAGVTSCYIRVTEYFDLGHGGGAPTYAVFVGPWTGDPVARLDNPFECLPLAYYEHIFVSGMAHPVGEITMQQGSQEAINELERQLRRTVKNGCGIDFYSPDMIDPEDLKKLRRGEVPPLIRLSAQAEPGKPPFFRVPAAEVGQTLLALLQIYERQYNSDSSSTELDRGSYAQTVRSATETAVLDAKSQQGFTISRGELLNLYERLVVTSLAVAAVGDRDECKVDVDGFNLTINDPSDPRLRIDQILDEPSNVLIDRQSVEQADAMRQSAIRLQQLQLCQPLVGKTVSPEWYTTQVLKAIGEKDPSEAMMQAQPAMPQQPGMPTDAPQLAQGPAVDVNAMTQPGIPTQGRQVA